MNGRWLLIMTFALLCLFVIAGGIAYKRELDSDLMHDQKLQDLLQNDRQQKEQIKELLSVVLYSRAVIDANQDSLTALMSKPSARPLKFDACDGRDTVNAARAAGIKIPRQDFEDRCEQEIGKK